MKIFGLYVEFTSPPRVRFAVGRFDDADREKFGVGAVLETDGAMRLVIDKLGVELVHNDVMYGNHHRPMVAEAVVSFRKDYSLDARKEMVVFLVGDVHEVRFILAAKQGADATVKNSMSSEFDPEAR